MAVPGLAGQLTARELEVLALLAAGTPNPRRAAVLAVTLDAVRKHVSHLVGNPGAANRTEPSPGPPARPDPHRPPCRGWAPGPRRRPHRRFQPGQGRSPRQAQLSLRAMDCGLWPDHYLQERRLGSPAAT
jgi:DNA-binding CsgD family transcriptional regulator